MTEYFKEPQKVEYQRNEDEQKQADKITRKEFVEVLKNMRTGKSGD